METIKVQAGSLQKGDEFVVGNYMCIVDRVALSGIDTVLVGYHAYCFENGAFTKEEFNTHMKRALTVEINHRSE